MSDKSLPRPPRKVRWWPALVILGLVVAAIIQLWVFADYPRQFKVMRTAGVCLVGVALLVFWLLLFSRLRWRMRFAVLGGFVALVALSAVIFRYEGVTGDLVPILAPRWKARARSVIAPPPIPRLPATNRALPATDYPQFLGPSRDGVITGVRLARDWTAHPPQLLWRKPVGQAWSGFAIVGARAVTQEQDGPNELIACCDLFSGDRLWVHSYAARYDNPIGGIGPRATPTISSNRVYALGSTGILTCLDLESGRVIWSTNVIGSLPGPDIEWGISSSPLLVNDLVVVAPRGASGRSLAAYRADTGAFVWAGGTTPPNYSSPRLESVDAFPQILTFTGAGAAGHDPATGALLWEYPWRGGHPHITDPRVVGTNLVLISSGYGTGSHLVEVRRTTDGRWVATNQVWRSMRLKSKFANVLVQDGFAYGLDDGRLVCLDLKDGSERWDGERYGHGQLLLAGDVILLTAENGDVALVEATPAAFRELARFHALKGKTWNPPALAGEILLVRNDREAAAYRLPLER